jgi:hypothetical protein
MRINGFEIFKDLQELLEHDHEKGYLNQQHGFEIRLVEFELRGDVMFPVIWLWDDYEKFQVGDEDDEWDGLTAEQAFTQLFKPQLDKHKFRITHNPFKK